MTISGTGPKPKPLSASEIENKLRELFRTIPDDSSLRSELEALGAQPGFPGLTWFWGPELYKRNRIIFRPFILSHFASWQYDPPSTWKSIPWAGDAQNRLEEWFRECDKLDDIELFRRLYQWKMVPTRGWRPDTAPFKAELQRRLETAETAARKSVVLRKFDIWFDLDEPTAIRIFRAGGPDAGRFLLRHLPASFSWWGGGKRGLWKELHEAAVSAGDASTAECLYRRQIPLDVWEKDALDACDRIRDSDALCERLGRMHPEGWGLDLGKSFVRLLECRGMELWGYLRDRLFQVQPGLILRSGYDDLLDLARSSGWWPLWAGLLRSSASPSAFNKEIRGLVNDRLLPESAIRDRLRLLAGVGWEFNLPGLGVARVAPLEDETAISLYERFPELVQGPFRPNLLFTYGNTYPKSLALFLKGGDEDLVDYLASRAITRLSAWSKNAVKMAETLSVIYEDLRGERALFTSRAAGVLGRIPAFAIHDYKRLIRENRLARLLFERSLDSWDDDPTAISNLVEASEIHVQALAYRILGRATPEAARASNANLPILLGTLLRPLHRRTRILAFEALFNAAIDRGAAGLIISRAKEAMDLPDLRYPKEKLLGLIGRLLSRWPALRSPSEVPVVFGEAS